MANILSQAATICQKENDSSIISGLTMNSHVIQQVREEVEHQMTQPVILCGCCQFMLAFKKWLKLLYIQETIFLEISAVEIRRSHSN